MTALIESGRIVDVILVVLIAEVVLLFALTRVRRLHVPLAGLLLNFAAGGSLLLGLQAVLNGAGWNRLEAGGCVAGRRVSRPRRRPGAAFARVTPPGRREP